MDAAGLPALTSGAGLVRVGSRRGGIPAARVSQPPLPVAATFNTAMAPPPAATLSQPLPMSAMAAGSQASRKSASPNAHQIYSSPNLDAPVAVGESGGASPTVFSSQHSSASSPMVNSATKLSFAAPLHMMSLQEFASMLQTQLASQRLSEHAITHAMAHVAPEDYPTIARLFEARLSLEDFVSRVVALQECPVIESAKLGLEMSFAEFKRQVLETVIPRSSNPLEEIHMLIQQLGPESKEMALELFLGRTSLSEFCRVLAAMHRPSTHSSFSLEELAQVTQSLLAAEKRVKIRNMEEVQTVVTGRMRHILTDWIVDVCSKFALCQETLHLSLALVDRYLMVQRIAKQELQLLGVSAIFIASKYEMVYPPELKEFVYIAACTYTREEIIRMERQLFVTLEYNLTLPTANAIANSILYQQDPTPTPKQKSVCGYLVDVMATVHSYGTYKPSLVAATCVFLSRVWCGVEPSIPLPRDILQFASVVVNTIRQDQSSRLLANTGKWGSNERHGVSREPIPPSVLGFAPGPVPSPSARSPEGDAQSPIIIG
jgi:hypothetical protein